MKKVVSVLLALAMALSCLCLSAFAVKEDRVVFWDGVSGLDNNTTYIIVENIVLSRDVRIPTTSTLIVKNNGKLTIPEEYTLTVKGTFTINNEAIVKLYGRIDARQNSLIKVFGTIKTSAGSVIDSNGQLNVYSMGKITGKGEINMSSFLGIDNLGTITATLNKPEPRNINGLTYVGEVLVANKEYELPITYDPGLNSEALAAYEEMAKAAKADGIELSIISIYRSYTKQQSTYQYWKDLYGEQGADMVSARPGKSEHQTGLAFDLNSLEQSFADTKEGKWLAENSWKYGFILRYPKGKSDITGYAYEPWHFRYVGKELAKRIYDSGLTLEEYLGIAK